MSCVPGTRSGQGSSASKELRAWGERQANRTAGPAPTASPIPLRLSSLQRHSATHSGPLSPGGADGQPQALAQAVLFRGGVPFPVLHKSSRCLSVRGPQRRDPQHPQTSANQDSAALCAQPWPDSLGRRHRVGASAWLGGGPAGALEQLRPGPGATCGCRWLLCLAAGGLILKTLNDVSLRGYPVPGTVLRTLQSLSQCSHDPRRSALFSSHLGDDGLET